MLVRAIVVDSKDPEKRGRVRVKYPGFSSDSESLESHWARICVPFASKNAGWVFVPKPQDEVMVWLDEGNLNTPIVMGSLFSPKNTPPPQPTTGIGANTETTEVKIIQTERGHRIVIDDGEDGGILVENASGDQIRFGTKGITIYSTKSIEFGEDAIEAVLKGSTFVRLFNTHTHPHPMGPTSPPAVPLNPDILSKIVKVK